MMADTLMVIIVGVMALALGVNLMALIGWVRGYATRRYK